LRCRRNYHSSSTIITITCILPVNSAAAAVIVVIVVVVVVVVVVAVVVLVVIVDGVVPALAFPLVLEVACDGDERPPQSEKIVGGAAELAGAVVRVGEGDDVRWAGSGAWVCPAGSSGVDKPLDVGLCSSDGGGVRCIRGCGGGGDGGGGNLYVCGLGDMENAVICVVVLAGVKVRLAARSFEWCRRFNQHPG